CMDERRSWNVIPEDLEGHARLNALNRREFLRRSAYTAAIGVSLAASLSPARVLAHAIRAQATDVPLGDKMPIDHFVILMMENRSFDHYFGWLDPEIANAAQHETYVDAATGKPVDTQYALDFNKTAPYQGCGYGDPGHGWDNGRAQLKGGFLA